MGFLFNRLPFLKEGRKGHVSLIWYIRKSWVAPIILIKVQDDARTIKNVTIELRFAYLLEF